MHIEHTKWNRQKLWQNDTSSFDKAFTIVFLVENLNQKFQAKEIHLNSLQLELLKIKFSRMLNRLTIADKKLAVVAWNSNN